MTRRWGEMEATPTMIWIQPPGTPTMGHLFLDAYHATGDDYYYRAAEQVAVRADVRAASLGRLELHRRFRRRASLRKWYDTIGKNAWRLEEFQHYYGNATFDDAGTAESAKFLLAPAMSRRSDPKYKAPLDKAIKFVLDSQYPIGVWPQRFPRAGRGVARAAGLHRLRDVQRRRRGGEHGFSADVLPGASAIERLIDPIIRGMNAFIVTQLGQPQPAWGLQHTLDLQPAGARTYEPKALVTHTTAANIGLLIRFYRLTGETEVSRADSGSARLARRR